MSSFRLPRRLWSALLLAVASTAALGANLIANPGFETQPLATNWTPYANVGALSASLDQPHSGTYAVLASNRTQSYAGPAQNLLGKLTAGVNYTVTAWVRLRQPGSQNFTLNMKQVDGAGTKYHQIDGLKVEHGRWAKLYGHFKYQPTGTVKTLQFYVTGPAAGVDFYVDDVTFDPPLIYTAPANPAATDFIRARGRDLVVGPTQQVIRLRGINFSGYADESSTAAAVYNAKTFDAIDYQRVKDMGFNAVRLNLWYRVFEENSAPYVYKPEGWQWLEQNLIWAKQAGLTLILDMHAPPGGFQGPDSNTGFWSNQTYRNRAKALLVAIASRYKNEPLIAAYDILNEPNPPKDATWQAWAKEAVAAIRAVDKNHLIIVEQSFAADSAAFIIPDDGNLLYEFHMYDPWRYTSQLSPAYGSGFYGSYPDPLVSLPPGSFTKSHVQNAPIPTGTTGWTYYQGTPVKITDPAVYAAVPAFFSTNNSGRVHFDDFAVDEFDASGTLTRRILAADVEDAAKLPSLWQWAKPLYDPFIAITGNFASAGAGGSGSKRNEASGHTGTSAVSIGATSGGTYGLINDRLQFGVRQGYSYRISGWIKGEAVAGGSGALGFQLRKLGNGQQRTPLTKDVLNTSIMTWSNVAFYAARNVPFTVGEFGVSHANIAKDLGGLRWLGDVMDIIEANGGNYFYWGYKDAIFGIHTNFYGFPDETTGNPQLINFFKQRFGVNR